MFKIESYITSIILANADRYIRNFRKQDAQVSLWEGDATFHNIDLNVEALNEEFHSPFVVISGYIHDLIIHVPWTKLTSEPVTITVNTIECVMRLKTKDERTSTVSDSKVPIHEHRPVDTSPPSSYTSALTSKIMNNLSIRCENVILKVVEEDIVFSMNIEKLQFENVNDSWAPTMTDLNAEKLQTRKLITLSGLTICLDKQNSSGRIETYMEPLLYRCLIHIRLLRGYHRAFSKSPVYTHFDILSEKMSFTFSEPQIPMLLKLVMIVLGTNVEHANNHRDSTLSAGDGSALSASTDSSFEVEANASNDASWGDWLWSMVPAILPQEDENVPDERDVKPTFHVGFSIKNLELNIKVWNNRPKSKAKQEFKTILESRLVGCFYQMITMNNEWLNSRFGVNYLSIEIPANGCENRINQVVCCGVENPDNFTHETLFHDDFQFSYIKMQQKADAPQDDDSLNRNDSVEAFDFMYNIEFSLSTHLNFFTENVLLERTAAFAVDYVKCNSRGATFLDDLSDIEKKRDPDSNRVDVLYGDAESEIEKPKSSVLLRLILGSNVTKITSDFLNRITYLHKIIVSSDVMGFRETLSGVPNQRCEQKSTYRTRFTLFDLCVEFHVPSSANFVSNPIKKDCKFSDIPESASSCHSTPILSFLCKCIDGEVNIAKTTQTVMVKTTELVWSLTQSNRIYNLIKCEKLDLKGCKNLNNRFLDVRMELERIFFESSKPNVLLASYIVYYLLYTLWHSEQRNNYYEKMFFSSLIDDTLLCDNTILELSIGSLKCVYQSFKETYAVGFVVNSCKAYAGKLIGNVPRRTVIFTVSESKTHSDFMKLRLQHSRNNDEECGYPTYIEFAIENIKLNMDPIFYAWINYQAVPNVPHKTVSKLNKNIRDNVPKSVPSRKVSDASSGSHGRKYGGSYPKPKESIHSSGEPETQSPTEVTETDLSDTFQISDIIPLPKPKVSFMQYVATELPKWCTYVVHGKVSDVTFYFPTVQTESTVQNDCDLERSLIDALRKNSAQNSSAGVFVFYLNSMNVKCDFPGNLFDELDSNVLLSVHKNVWSADKSTSPWDVSIKDFRISTLSEENIRRPLLKSFSANCSVGVSFRTMETGESVAALCVHFDFQPLFVILTKRQTVLISSAIELLGNLLKESRKRSLATVASEESCSRSPSLDVSESDPVRKLTGWIQWTFTKCSLNICHEDGSEMAKLSVETEDSIVSLEFDDVFHKFKIKLTTFGIYHLIKSADLNSWTCGPFCGALVQRCYSQPSSALKAADDDIGDRFSLVTITRARSSNLSSRLSSNPCSEIHISSSSDCYVTEIILDICPIDLILPLNVLNKFLSVLKPLLSRNETTSRSDSGTVEPRNEHDNASTSLPLTYLNIPKLRIYIPLSGFPAVGVCPNYDTVICEVHGIVVDCHPKNPILRRQGHSKFFQTSSGKRYATVEQKLHGQQYQLFSESVSVKTGKWFEIEPMIFKEQSSMKGPPSVFEQNPAVMWNQGYHPENHENDQSYLRSIIASFSCHLQLAPSIKCYSLRTTIQGPQLEVNILTDLEVTISLPQLCLLIALYNDYVRLILKLFAVDEKKPVVSPTHVEIPSCRGTSIRTNDSGIESLEQNSASSSTISRSKSEAQTPNVHHSTVKPTNTSASLSHVSNTYKSTISTPKKVFLEDVFITAPKIDLIFYSATNVERVENNTTFVGLFLCKIVQPSVSFNNEKGYPGVQIEIFDASVRIPDPSSSNLSIPCVPSCANFSFKILEVRKLNYEPYSQIPYACFTFKILQNMRRRWKVECMLEQPLFVACELQVIRYLFSTVSKCVEEYEEYVKLFHRSSYGESTAKKDVSENNADALIDRLNSFSSLDFHSGRLIVVLKSTNAELLLNADSIAIHVKPPSEIRTQNESIFTHCEVNSIAVSLPRIQSCCLSDILAKDECFTADAKKQDFLSNLIIEPWNLKAEIALFWHRSNSFRNRPSKCLKVDSETISFNVSPSYIEKLSRIVSLYYVESIEPYLRKKNTTDSINGSIENDGAEFYKDDLRAGAFQYIKIDEEKNDLPSPYEVYFCNRRVHPFMCWRYPQPRSLTKLQIYPLLVDDSNDEFVENEIRCQLQYYDEMTKTYEAYVVFNLCENSIQNITLPCEKPRIVAAEAWRIVLFDFVDSHDSYDIKMDIKSLVGYVRVDSVFQPSQVPEMQVLMNISELLFHFYVSCENANLAIEDYFMDYTPSEQCFLTAACNDVKITMSDFRSEKIIKISGIGKANMLNYEYLMLQSFIDPFFSEAILYYAADSTCKLATKTKMIHVRMSPQFVHTLSVAQHLWHEWKPNSPLSWRVTAPYIMCNSTNQLIMFHQENTSRDIYLSPGCCHLFAWFSPAVPKLLRLSVFCGQKQYTSEPFGIGAACSETVVCKNEEGERCALSITIVQHSSVVHQIIIRGSLLAYNTSQSEIDMCVISHGKKAKNKLSSAQIVSTSTLTKRRLYSLVLPLEHQLVFKIRFASSVNEGGPAQWSGLISLKTSLKGSNQTSWLVKIPLRNHKEHFQSVWCQLTFETDQEFPVYLVAFRPLCSVVSFLPWIGYFRIYNELGTVVDTAISSRGQVTDLHISDTVSVDKYSIECRYDDNSEKCVIKMQLEPTPKNQNNDTKFYSIRSLLADIEMDSENSNRWPYTSIEAKNLQWKTNQPSENVPEPIIKVLREERTGCGTRIELYPWAIITNLLDHPIILATSNAVYTIGANEIFAPPLLEGTFKIGLVENEISFFSGTLQLADDQSFPIPKVTGRIPMNGFITTMIACDNHVSFVNITSKNHRDIRIISICSSYVINNNSSLKIGCSAWVICRSGAKSTTSFDLPLSLEYKSMYLASEGDENAGQPITKWYTMGTGDVQVLPYLILTVGKNVACPVRICDLSEKQRYPVVFSNGKSSDTPGERLPSVFMTAQQNDGQVFLTLWDEKVPQITIHNMSQLSLNVIASRSESGNGAISCSVDWNWKFKVSAECSAHFHTQNQTLEKAKKQFNEFLMFAVESKKHVKQTKWSSGVPLASCVNQLITLPLSQHHIKLAIFKNGFTFVVWIESATADELSAKMIRARLSESFLPINEGAVVPLTNEDSDVGAEDDLEVPDRLRRMYNSGLLKPISTNIFVEEICLTLAGDDEQTLDENDIVTFCAKNVFSTLTSIRKQNEVAPDILCHVSADEYQLDNDEYCFRAYDFPVVLLSQRATSTNTEYPIQQRVDDLLLNAPDYSSAALKINVYLNLDRNFSCSIREVELNFEPLNVYLEDKYLGKLKSMAEKLISAVMEAHSLNVNHCQQDGSDENAIMPLNLNANYEPKRIESVKLVETAPEKAISSASKSVNLSEEFDVEDKASATCVDIQQIIVQRDEGTPEPSSARDAETTRIDERERSSTPRPQEHRNHVFIPDSVIKRSKLIAKPIRLRGMYISPMHLTVSVHTSTTFYIALDRSPLKFSEFKKQYLTMTPFELGNVLVLHYFFGAIYGTGWAISSLEFVGSPGVLARNLGTGVMDFISMPLYGISSGPRGLILGIAHGSASLMKHTMAGTLSSVTNFAGSWARTLNRFTLDADDLLQSEQIRRFPPNNITEGILQGLAEFGISLLGGISGIAHHPLQYVASNPGAGNRSLLNSISLGLVGVLTRPLSGAAELVARTGQGIMSHVGWNTIPAVRNGSGLSYGNNNSGLQICNLKYEWKRDFEHVILSVEGVKAEDISSSVCLVLTSTNLHVIEANDSQKRLLFPLQTHEFGDNDDDPTLICIRKPALNIKTAEDFSQARIYKFINETNQCFNIKSSYATENEHYLTKAANSFAFCVHPQIKSFLLNMISFVKQMDCSNTENKS